MPLQPKISPENHKLRIADREKEIPTPDNEDGSFNLDGYRFKPGQYDRYTSWFTFIGDIPVYKEQTYLPRTLKALALQTVIKDCEIILSEYNPEGHYLLTFCY